MPPPPPPLASPWGLRQPRLLRLVLGPRLQLPLQLLEALELPQLLPRRRQLLEVLEARQPQHPRPRWRLHSVELPQQQQQLSLQLLAALEQQQPQQRHLQLLDHSEQQLQLQPQQLLRRLEEVSEPRLPPRPRLHSEGSELRPRPQLQHQLSAGSEQLQQQQQQRRPQRSERPPTPPPQQQHWGSAARQPRPGVWAGSG